VPVSYLTATQRKRCGCYPAALSADNLERYFHHDDGDREWIAAKRRDSSHLRTRPQRWSRL